MLKVQNTLTGKKEDFKPRDKGKVAMYVCGPTVYNYIHIGNARAYIAFDVIYRYLKYKGYDVTYVRNLTDVDDKIIKKAQEEGISTEKIAQKYTKAFWDDMKTLGIEKPQKEPKATKTIQDMIEVVKGLIDKEFAYEVGGDVFYRVKAFTDYGKLSKRSLDEMIAGSRVEVDDRKEHPMDFALWKKAKEGEPAWDSPWGKGRPGWHIECSTMSQKYLGANFDIHGGGQDLIFPHHENEIAQSEGLTGESFVKYWLHNGFVNVKEEKMAKSVGNVVLIKDLKERYKGDLKSLRNDLRMLFLTTGYHAPINFSFENLGESHPAVVRIEETIRRIDFFIKEASVDNNKDDSGKIKNLVKTSKEEFEKDMDDDFNTPQAISRIFDLSKEINTLLDKKNSLSDQEIKSLEDVIQIIIKLSEVLGFSLNTKMKLSVNSEKVFKLVSQREEARKNKDYKRADLLRDEVEKLGLSIEDTPFGPRIVKRF